MRKLSIILALLAGTMMPLTAAAQDSSTNSSASKKKSKKTSKKVQQEEVAAAPAAEELTFSDEQAMLNNQAVDAMAAQNYAKAEQLFLAELQLGEFNITWMNLGKTYASEGKCIEAADAYSRVANARKISDYAPEEINAYTQNFIKELDQKCSAKVVMNCVPADMMISFDGGTKIQCSDKPIKLVPGRHSVYGETSFGFNTVAANLPAGQTTTVEIEVVDPEKVLADAGITLDALNSKSRLFKILGYTFIGVGAPTLGAGLGLTLYYWLDYREKWNANAQDSGEVSGSVLKSYKKVVTNRMNIGYGLIVVGSVALVAGMTLVIIDAVRFQPQIKMLEATKSAFHLDVAPVISPEFSGLSLTGTF